MLGTCEALGCGPAQARLAAEAGRGNGGNPRAGGATGAILEFAPIGPQRSGDAKPGRPFGQEARDYLDYLIGSKKVRIDMHGTDQPQRVIGVVRDGSVIVNLPMAAMGYAEVYRSAP